jgi:hypothetical protein
MLKDNLDWRKTFISWGPKHAHIQDDGVSIACNKTDTVSQLLQGTHELCVLIVNTLGMSSIPEKVE